MIHQRTIESTKQLLQQHILTNEAVQTVVMDMWKLFHKAEKSMFSQVTIVVDKYYVIQKVTQALDQMRKKYPEMKQVRYSFRENEKITDQQKMKLDELLGEHSDFACAYFQKVERLLSNSRQR